MKILLPIIFAIAITSAAFASEETTTGMEGATVSATRPIDVDVIFDTTTFESQPWTKEFHYVIVVNKANKGKDAQTIKIYEFGQLIRQDKVSTGRDAFEKKGEHGSKNDSWTVTPTGYYTPAYLDRDHKSGAYGGKWSWLTGGVKMPFAIFFNGGIALHQAPKGTEGDLGTKASGGCVRLPGAVASDLFARVQDTKGSLNPRFNVDGTGMYDAEGHLMHAKNEGFSTLIVVQNKIIE